MGTGWGTKVAAAAAAIVALTAAPVSALPILQPPTPEEIPAPPVDWAAADRAGSESHSLALTPNGRRVLLAGVSFSDDTRYDFMTTAYRAETGERLWRRRDVAGPYNELVAGMAVDGDGRRVFVAGTSTVSSSESRYVTVARDVRTGKRLWTKRFEGAREGKSTATSIAVGPRGRIVFVTGYARASRSGYDYATVAYRARDGRVMWKRYFGSDGADRAFGIAIQGDNVIVTGHTKEGGRRHITDRTTVAYSMSDGTRRWSATEPLGRSVGVVASDERVYVFGDSHGEREGVETIAYDATGRRLWRRLFSGSFEFTRARGLALDPAGGVVSISAASGATDDDFLTLSYGPDGDLRWAQIYDGPAGGIDWVRSVSVARGLAVVSGMVHRSVSGWDAEDQDVATVAYDAATGLVRWVAHSDGGYWDWPGGLVVDPHSQATYVGSSSSDESREPGFLTLRYGG